MELNVCKHCKKTYASKRKGYTCPDCETRDQVEFLRIMHYLEKYPNSSAPQVAKELGIDVYTMLKYIDEGRLVMRKGTFSPLPDNPM